MMKITFDAVQWIRRRHAEIDEEDRGLSWEEKRCKAHDIVMSDPILAALYTQSLDSFEKCANKTRETDAGYGGPES